MQDSSPLLPSLRRHAWQLFIASLAEWRVDAHALYEVTIPTASIEGLGGEAPDEYLTRLLDADVAHLIQTTNGVTKHGRPRWAMLNVYSLRYYNAASRSFAIVFNPFASDVLGYLQSIIDELRLISDALIPATIHLEIRPHGPELCLSQLAAE